MNLDKLDKLYTIAGYSKQFCLSRPTVYKRIKEKQLETIRIASKTFIKAV